MVDPIISIPCCGAGLAATLMYAHHKYRAIEGLSENERRVVEVVGSVFLAGLMVSIKDLYSDNSIQPIKTPPHLTGIQIQKPLAPPVLPKWNNLGTVWEKGDFVVGGLQNERGQTATLMASKARVVRVVEEGSAAVEATCYQNWVLIFEGDSLAKLKGECHKWTVGDLLRPIEVKGEAMTFCHLPSRVTFTAKIRKMNQLTYIDL